MAARAAPAITGAWVALSLALRHLVRMNVLKTSPLTGQVAAVSCGLVGGAAVLDLDYAEDSGADADANFVLTDGGGIVEIQGTAEKAPFSEAQFAELMALAKAGTGAAVRRRSARRWSRADGAPAGARAARLVIATPQPGQAARDCRPAGAARHLGWCRPGALGLPEPEETAPDFVGNARIKALAAAAASGLPALADDFGFCVAALGGAPGVVSARWAGPAKDFARGDGAGAARSGRRRDRRAWFVACLCLAWPDGHTETFLGRVDGTMVWPPRGAHGFGYDPMFVPAGGTLTYGEMEPDEKHAVSHRARRSRSCWRGASLPLRASRVVPTGQPSTDGRRSCDTCPVRRSAHPDRPLRRGAREHPRRRPRGPFRSRALLERHPNS